MKPASPVRRRRDERKPTAGRSRTFAAEAQCALVLVRDHLCDLLGWMGAALKTGLHGNPARHHAIPFHRGNVARRSRVDIARRGKLEKSARGIAYGVLNGVLSGAGGLALFAAYHTNGNTTLITATSALYPMITVLLAVVILRESFRPIQALGLVFAAAAIVIFSL